MSGLIVHKDSGDLVYRLLQTHERLRNGWINEYLRNNDLDPELFDLSKVNIPQQFLKGLVVKHNSSWSLLGNCYCCGERVCSRSTFVSISPNKLVMSSEYDRFFDIFGNRTINLRFHKVCYICSPAIVWVGDKPVNMNGMPYQAVYQSNDVCNIVRTQPLDLTSGGRFRTPLETIDTQKT